MKTPEEIKKGLECCKNGDCFACPYCAECHYDGEIHTPADESIAYIEALEEENERLHEQISLMLIQMRGDCGTCKHKKDWTKCSECARKEDRPLWEYEGLPEVCHDQPTV